MKAGILSDTHDLLRPEAEDALRGCDCILTHPGVTTDGIMTRLGLLGKL